MRQHRVVTVALAAVALVAGACGGDSGGDSNELAIGLNVEITGTTPKIGEHSALAAEMFVDEFNEAGGIELDGESYTIRLITEDNNRTAEGAVAAATKLITQDNVLAMIGPNPSTAAVPAGEVANNGETPMISPWSTNPATTEGRPWVFRAAFLDLFQSPVLAKFAAEEFDATTACVLYDVAEDAPVGQAEAFKEAWEETHGDGSVKAFETFVTGDVDFSAQLTNIAAAGCEVFFVPQYYNQVPDIVQQAKALGLTMPILGSDAWGDPQLLELCGDACDGYFYSTHYVVGGASGPTLEFIEKFEDAHPNGETPSEIAALTWDSMRLLVQALENCGTITGDLEDDRTCIRDGIGQITDFDGITGRMTFSGTGDPEKCVIIVRIEDGDVTFHDSVCP